ncbi:metallophosphoesterase [Mesorhizobium sp. KR2-14]|uniref:metallophosphoesterase family protein n=1 Tax=Mesorhizobium sp. KR2-14 TaxID=3156610 RepID=UPI0032B5F351
MTDEPATAGQAAGPIIDPRFGDIEDDASSPKRRSLLSLAGSLLLEISLPKLILAWILLLVVPGLLLGLAPIIVSSWVVTFSVKIASLVIGFWSLLVLAAIIAAGWFGWRALFRMTERNFWSLNAVVVQPAYAAFREALNQLTERLFARNSTAATRSRLRAVMSAVAGVLVCALALLACWLAWPSAHLFADISEISSWSRVAIVALANSIVLVSAYLAVAALFWGFADATMAQPRNLERFETAPPGARRWRVAHLSDVHVVGERYGFRIESGRAGARGNDRLKRILNRLDEIDAAERLDAILITGDMTDAGVSTEWAEFLDAVAAHPRLVDRVLMLPGNHDLNIVDRANPARMDLPTSPNRRLRQIRALSAMISLQGKRAHVVDLEKGSLGPTLEDALQPHIAEMSIFADEARPRLSNTIPEVWARAFPMVVPPRPGEPLGIILLNSNADTHFSFTNALGMISAGQMRGIEIASAEYPDACWIVALHHHVVEYPWAAKKLSERIGTALINGKWFVRRMQSLSGKAILMHGHRHIDWIGECGGLPIVSAPSPVMHPDAVDTAFYIHRLAVGEDGLLRLLTPERVVIRGERSTADLAAG